MQILAKVRKRVNHYFTLIFYLTPLSTWAILSHMKSNQSKRGIKPERGVSVKVSVSAYSLLREMAKKELRSISQQIEYLVLEARGKA